MPLQQNDVPGQHVPAWKRLGLKLKHALDANDSVTTNYPQTVHGKKRKRSSDENALRPTDAFDGQKKNADVKVLGSPTNISNPDPSLSLSQSTSPADQESHSRLKRIRKSVSFTPDTKKTDGDSIKQLYKTWLNFHLAKDSSFDPSIGNPALQVIKPRELSFTNSSPSLSQPTQIKKAKKSKGSERSKEQKNPSNHEAKEFSSLPRHATLDYLHTYHTSPSLWKFSKSRQTHLLRNLFSPGFIPPSYDTALKAYLSGLQGEGAKSRLRTMARKIVVEGFQELGYGVRERYMQEGYAREKKRHMDWLEREVKVLEKDAKVDEEKEIVIGKKELSEKYWIKRIADVVLWSVGDDPGSEAKSDHKDGDDQKVTRKANKANTQSPLSKKRKRKNRSLAMSSSSDDDSSTNSSSSSSSSSSSDARLARNLANLEKSQKFTSQALNPTTGTKRARHTEDHQPSNAVEEAGEKKLQAKTAAETPKRAKPKPLGHPQPRHSKYGSPFRPRAGGLTLSPRK
jgi:hypothetical protein